MESSRARHLVIAMAITVVGTVLYSNSVSAPFVFDDYPNIVKNPAVQHFELGLEGLYRVAFESPSKRPVANISFALNHHFAGAEVESYHAVNIAIHIATALLVYAFTHVLLVQSGALRNQAAPLRNLPIQPTAALVALVFVAHPIQTESVTYVVQRMNSLAALFYLAALLLYAAGRREPGRRRWLRWGGAAACWLAALGSKQVAITLPLVIALYEWFFFRDLDVGWLVRNRRYFLGAIGAAAVLAIPNVDLLNLAGYADRDFTLGERLLTQLRVVVFYLSLLLYPHPSRLNISHEFAVSHSLVDPISTLFSLVALATGLLVAVLTAARWRLCAFGILWFYLHLILESTILPLEMVFEHRLYLPMFGIDLAAMCLLFGGLATRPRLALAVSLTLVSALCVATYARNLVWSEPVSLWSDTIAKSPDDHRAHFNLGVALGARGRFEEAIHHHSESLRLEPLNAAAHNGLGVALAGLGRYPEAVRHFAASLRIDPNDPEARSNIALAIDKMSGPETRAEE